MTPQSRLLLLAALLPALVAAGCSKAAPSAADSRQAHKHHHHPPHEGTPVVLGEEDYHVELVLNTTSGKLQAFVLDGEMENFVRSTVPSIVITAAGGGAAREVELAAVPNPETGETVGDTALFEGQADWLRSAKDFDAVLKSITIRGTTYANVKFNFPRGNDAGD
jgi:hypothetical protein